MDKNNGSSGVELSGVLAIVFIVLKLVGVINWSWWWVLSPIWIGIALWLIVIAICAIYITHENKKYGITYTKRKKDKWKF